MGDSQTMNDLMIKLTGWRRRGASRSARPSSQSLAPGTSCRSLQVAFKTNHSVNCSHEISMESVFHLLPRTKDPSCLFEPKIALFGFDGGLPMLSIRYCAIYILSSGTVQDISYYFILSGTVQYIVIY